MLPTENHKWFKVVVMKISFEHVDFWAKSLLFRTHHLWNSTTELTLVHSRSPRLLVRWQKHNNWGSQHQSLSCSPVVQYDEADIILVLQPQQHKRNHRACFYSESVQKITQLRARPLILKLVYVFGTYLLGNLEMGLSQATLFIYKMTIFKSLENYLKLVQN